MDAIDHLTPKQRMFVAYYLGESQGNATDAARRAGYAHPNHVAHRLKLLNVVTAAVETKAKEVAITAQETLLRLCEIATADLADFLDLDAPGGPKFDLSKAEKAGKTHLIRKITQTRQGPIVELYDAQAALLQIGKFHGLWMDRVQVGQDLDLSQLTDEQLLALEKGKSI